MLRVHFNPLHFSVQWYQIIFQLVKQSNNIISEQAVTSLLGLFMTNHRTSSAQKPICRHSRGGTPLICTNWLLRLDNWVVEFQKNILSLNLWKPQNKLASYRNKFVRGRINKTVRKLWPTFWCSTDSIHHDPGSDRLKRGGLCWSL